MIYPRASWYLLQVLACLMIEILPCKISHGRWWLALTNRDHSTRELQEWVRSWIVEYYIYESVASFSSILYWIEEWKLKSNRHQMEHLPWCQQIHHSLIQWSDHHGDEWHIDPYLHLRIDLNMERLDHPKGFLGWASPIQSKWPGRSKILELFLYMD